MIYTPYKCERCGRIKDTLVVVHCVYVPPRPPERFYPDGTPGRWYRRGRRACLDSEACRARRAKRDTRAKQRSEVIVVADPKAPDAPRGVCRWCGEDILRPDGKQDRRRNYHDDLQRPIKGNGWKTEPRVPAEPPCLSAYLGSRFHGARDFCWSRDQGKCAGCGRTEPRHGAWAADHILALEDGGDHAPENLQTLCNSCHGSKTAQENRVRGAARRAENPPAPPPVHPGQLTWGDIA